MLQKQADFCALIILTSVKILNNQVTTEWCSQTHEHVTALEPEQNLKQAIPWLYVLEHTTGGPLHSWKLITGAF